MRNDIKKIQEDFIELAGNLSSSINVSRIIGQIYALLYLSENPVSMDEIVDRLKVSKGNISVNINILENWGAVRPVWVKGSRKNYYRADSDIWKVVKNRVEEGFSRRFDNTISVLESINDKVRKNGTGLQSEEKSKIEFYKKRMSEINSIVNKLSGIVKLLKTLS